MLVFGDNFALAVGYWQIDLSILFDKHALRGLRCEINPSVLEFIAVVIGDGNELSSVLLPGRIPAFDEDLKAVADTED